MHIKTIFGTLLTVTLLTPSLLAAQKPFHRINTLMADKEMETPDLNDLSRRQLDALNTRLIRHTAKEATVLQVKNKAVIEAEADRWTESVRN